MTLNFFNNVPRTYLGLSKLIESLRMMPGWGALPDQMQIELLVAICYLRIGAVDGIKQFETNDYFRRALGRRNAIDLGIEDWLNSSRGIAALSALREFFTNAQKVEDSPYKFLLNESKGSPVLVNSELRDGFGTAWEEWFKWEDPFRLISEYDRLMVDVLITNRLFDISRSCVFPEFRLLQNRFCDDVDAEHLESQGYLIKPGFLSDLQIMELREIVYELAKVESINNEAYFYGNENRLQRIYNILNKSPKFAEIFLGRAEIFELLQQFFGGSGRHTPYYLSSFQANILNPGARAQVLHVDSSVPDPLPPWKIRLNINLLLDPFTEKNGATLVYPGSHKFLRKPTSGDDVSLQMRKVIAPAGSLVLWTGHLWHQSGSNHDTRPRAALLACFAASYLREVSVEENYLEVMHRDRVESLPFEVKTLLGYYHGRKV